MLPRDPAILLSYVNMKLRDEYSGLEDLCRAVDTDAEKVVEALAVLGYGYYPVCNQFVAAGWLDGKERRNAD